MDADFEREESQASPPIIDEGYWSSLLNEEELAESQGLGGDAQAQGFDDEHNSPLYSDHGQESFTRPANNTQNILDSDWETIQAVMHNDEVIELTVVGYNRGGLLVQWNSLRGFVPASQLVRFPATENSTVRRNAMQDCVGQKLNLRIIELSPAQNRLILSERAAQAEPGERANILTKLKPGDTIGGFVTNLCDFGAFVDLGGLEGLVHISELSWGRVEHPADMLKRGEEVEAFVLDINEAEGRIALSLKRLSPDPWQTVHQRYQIGEIVEGTITNVVDFGAFACIEKGLEGLIHVSELAEGHFLHPRNVVTEGQEVQARILSINGQSRRLGLSLRLEE